MTFDGATAVPATAIYMNDARPPPDAIHGWTTCTDFVSLCRERQSRDVLRPSGVMDRMAPEGFAGHRW